MSEPQIESLKLLHDWSKWLIGLEAGVCALLWRVLSQSKIFFAAWLMFWLSILAAAILLLAISVVVGQRYDVAKRYMKHLWILVAAEYVFFAAGMVVLVLRASELPHS